jgi:hypothetical protein
LGKRRRTPAASAFLLTWGMKTGHRLNQVSGGAHSAAPIPQSCILESGEGEKVVSCLNLPGQNAAKGRAAWMGERNTFGPRSRLQAS